MTSPPQELVLALFRGLALAALFNAPLLYLLWRTRLDRRTFQTAANASLRELPLRPPGESIQRKINALLHQREKLTLVLSAVVCLGCIAGLSAPAQVQLRVWVGGVFFLVLAMLFIAPKFLRITRQIWMHRLAFLGEQLVAEELNQLLHHGYRVFHDVPCQGYNIDHVIVGPTGVFAIETQTRLEAKADSSSRSRVRYDGDSLFFSRQKDSGAVDQALFNGRSLSHWLGSVTGVPVPVQPIVTVPGWSIDDNFEHRVWVLHPQRIKSRIEVQDGDYVLPEQIERIAEKMTDRCRIESSPFAA